VSQFDQKVFRNLMGNFCSGIVVVTSEDSQSPIGFTAQSFVSLSLEPPLIAICPAKTSKSWERIRATEKFAVNILSAQLQDVSNNFASSKPDKFKNIAWTSSANGLPIINDTLAYIDCELEAEHDAGDHTIAVGVVRAYAQVCETDAPLLYFRGAYL
jgi:3-hydroxy-9,10-secoandrosta-1,3,5(10)-triene-9,17-dione monooxygenase reductase component